MKQKWREKMEKFEALEKRERLLIVGAIMAGIFLTWDFMLTQPMAEDMKLMLARERVAKQDINASEAEKTVLEKLAAKDPNAELKRELEELNSTISELDGELEQLSAGLVTSEQLPLVLGALLQRSSDIEVVRMTTLPAREIALEREPIKEKPAPSTEEELTSIVIEAATTDPDQISLFRHGVNLVVRGSYYSVLEYLQRLESSSWQFYWESLDYKVKRYPIAEVTLKVFTLSADRER